MVSSTKDFCGRLIIGICLLAGIVRGVDDDTQMRILELARSGQNAEAISAYEALPDKNQTGIDVLRAAAGCYWRERRFEEARSLYRVIMKRQSNLNSLESNVQDTALDEDESPTPAPEKPITPAAKPETQVPATMQPTNEPEASEQTLPTSDDNDQMEDDESPPVAEPKASAVSVKETSTSDADVDDELEALNAQLQALKAEREKSRLAAEAQIADLTAAASEKSQQLEALRAQLEAQSTATEEAETTREQEQRAGNSKAAALEVQINTLEKEVESARTTHEQLEADAERKINDLLDSVKSEKARREKAEADLQATAATLEVQKALVESRSSELQQQVHKARQQLEQERSLAEAAAADHQLREVELRARIAQITAVGEQTKLQVALLEETLQQLRDQLDSVRAQFTTRNQTLAGEIDRVDNDSIELALDEIERLEEEQAASDALAAQQQAKLEAQIAQLESEATKDQESLARLGSQLEDERRRRFELEAKTQEQMESLKEKEALLEDAKLALTRQYDALREHVQGGTTLRLENGGAPESEAVQASPDLVPMIGQLEAATATAVEEVNGLRERLQKERETFEKAIADKESEIAAMRTELADMNKRLETITTEAIERESRLEAAHADAITAMTDAHEDAVAELRTELSDLKKMLAARDRAVDMLEDELTAERAGTARILSMARETEETLTARIHELETKPALPKEGESTSEIQTTPAPGDAVFDAILAMVASDKATAVARFEALPANTKMPDPVLKAMGNLYRERGNYKAARILFQQLVDRHPDDPYAERKLVMTLFDMGLYDEALGRLSTPRASTSPPAEMK